MSMRGALVDRAHVLEVSEGAIDAYGEGALSAAPSVTFRCRVSKPDPREVRNNDIEFTQYERDLIMLVGMKDEDGTLIALEADDRVVVEDGVFAGTYDIVGKPVPIRKKRTQIGWTFDLKESTGKAA